MNRYKHFITITTLCFITFFMISCFGSNKKNVEKEQEIITEGGEDYVKVPNPLYAVWQGQPQFVYVPKSQYQPLLGERFAGEDVRLKTKFLERKIARLEKELKSGEYMGGGGGIAIPANRVMKKTIVILPLEDQTGSLNKEKESILSSAISMALDRTKQAVLLRSTVLKTFKNKKWWKDSSIDEDLLGQAGSSLGIQAFLQVKINRLEITHKTNTENNKYKATLSLTLIVYDGLSGRKINTTPIQVLPEEIPAANSPVDVEKRALRSAAKKIAFSATIPLSKLEWFTHIVRVDKKKVFIQGGRDDGLYVGDLLNVYEKPGKEIFNQLTGEYMGREPGKFKGRIQLVEFFGINAAIAKPVLGENFKVGDFVKLAR